MTTTIPSIHTYQQGEYERLVAQLACEHETWESVQPHELLPVYDALMRRDGEGWDALIYHDNGYPEGETALYLIRHLLALQESKEGRAQLIGSGYQMLFSMLDRLTRNLSHYYDENIKLNFLLERATLLEQGLPWWKRREFEATRRAIRDRAEGEK